MTVISPFCEVTLAYLVTDESGNCLAQSTTEQPLKYLHAGGQLLPALETALEGHQTGDQVSVLLTPEQGYGPHRPELVFEAVHDNLPTDREIHVGMTLIPGGQRGKFSLKVVGLTERGAMLDGNHPLAGKTVTWDFTVLQVSPSQGNTMEVNDYQPIRWVNLDD